MSAIYFWKKGKVEVAHPLGVYTTTDALKDGRTGLPCVDTKFNRPDQRYGVYAQEEGGEFFNWEPLPINTFPAEFRLQLLLLGVS